MRPVSTLLEGALVSAALTVIAVLIHGYHPYAEDGGPYFASVLKALHPNLYPSWPAFVSAFAQYSIFARLIAGLIRISGFTPAVLIFLLHILSVFAALIGAWLVAVRCYPSHYACCGAVSLLALWLTIPVAGTSLILFDPYFTARSISTPCGLFALAAMLDIAHADRMEGRLLWRSSAVLGVAMTIALLVHPLMAAYTTGCLVLLYAASRPRRSLRIWSMTAICAIAIAGAGLALKLAPPVTADCLLAARSRTYWFLRNWHWYEIAGLIAPLLILQLLTLRPKIRAHQGPRWLARMAIAAGATALAISLLYVHEFSSSYPIARLQPLRIFHSIYLIMILLLGAFAGERLRFAPRWQPVLAFLSLAAIMLCVQLRTFPASAHIELPWSPPRNGWEQAFVWIRHNTPPDALFALDAEYIVYPGEDAQYFNAIAERSALPDYSKDGGLASISPRLAGQWALGDRAQTGLNCETDAERIAALQPFSVGWIVLPAFVATQLPCLYSNAAAKVCRIDAAQPEIGAANRLGAR